MFEICNNSMKSKFFLEFFIICLVLSTEICGHPSLYYMTSITNLYNTNNKVFFYRIFYYMPSIINRDLWSSFYVLYD